MSPVLDLPITTGAVRAALLAVGVVAVVVLAVGSGRRWWTRSIPLALLAAGLVAIAVVVVVDVLWRPFPDPLPRVTAVWVGLTVGAGVLAVAHRVGLARRTGALVLVAVVGGRDDTAYRPPAQVMLGATRAAGMSVTYFDLPAPQSWQVWRPGLQQSLAWLATRTGLTA